MGCAPVVSRFADSATRAEDRKGPCAARLGWAGMASRSVRSDSPSLPARSSAVRTAIGGIGEARTGVGGDGVVAGVVLPNKPGSTGESALLGRVLACGLLGVGYGVFTPV